jgi:4-hydroxy-tetrahydrodipicolinate synthase
MHGAIPLKGIIVPLVTPLADRDRLDDDGLQRVIEHVIAGGVHGLFLLGTTGEAPSLSERLKRELIELACRQVHGRVPVLVGVTDTSLVDSIALARFAAEQQAQGVVLAPPPYFPLNQADLAAYVREFAAESPLPLYLYNMPSHSKVEFEPATVRGLLDLPNLAGIKDSSGQMLYFNELLQLAADRPDLTVLMGPEELLAESVLIGGHGGVCGGANLHPRLYVELYEAAISGDLNLVHKLQHRVLRLSARLYSVGDPPSGYLTGLKCAMSCLGLCSDRLAEPLHALSDDRRATIARHLKDLGLTDSAVARPQFNVAHPTPG